MAQQQKPKNPPAEPETPPAAPTVDEQVVASAEAVDATASGDQRRAAEKRRASLAGPNDSMVEALLVERRGYVQRGMEDRVAQVDEQLRLRGAEPPKD